MFSCCVAAALQLFIQVCLHDTLEIDLRLVLKEEHTQFQLTFLKIFFEKMELIVGTLIFGSAISTETTQQHFLGMTRNCLEHQ